VAAGLTENEVEAMAQLIRRLRDELDLTVVWIEHAVTTLLRHVERVIVLHQGRIVEQGPPAQLFQSPTHPYTRALVAAMPLAPTGVQKPSLPPLENAP